MISQRATKYHLGSCTSSNEILMATDKHEEKPNPIDAKLLGL